MKSRELLCLVLIIVLAVVLRFYRITQNPPHLYWDEASIAYNAYSINLTGEDEWGDHNPLLFKSFGDYKLPLYIYITALSQKVFGLTDLAVRFPSALAGTLTVMLMFWLVKEQIYLIKQKFKNFSFINKPSALALLASLFLAISPWHLQFSRAGFEANVALFCRAAALLFFLLAIRKNIWLLFISFFFFAASVYTYHSAAVSAPLILTILAILFRRELLAKWKRVFLAFIFLTLIILPYLPSYVLSAHGRVRATSESFLNMTGNLVVNFVNNYVANFDTDFLFFHGDQQGRHSVKKMGELYLWQLPVILAGIYFLIRYRSKTTVILFGWLLIAALPVALTRVSPHALRDLLAVRSWQTISALGFVFLLSKIPRWSRLLFVPIIVYGVFVYLNMYYFFYPVAYAADWQDGQRQTITFLKSHIAGHQKIYIMKDLEPIYIQLYWPIDPRILHSNNHDTSQMAPFEYFDFNHIPAKSKTGEKNLIALPAWASGGDDWEFLRQIKNNRGDPVFNIYEL